MLHSPLPPLGARIATALIALAIAAIGMWLFAPSIQAALPPDEDVAVHHVRAGDTLPRLCWQYKVRLEAIQTANPGVADPLSTGQQLVIPLGPVAPSATAAAATTTKTVASAATPVARPVLRAKAATETTRAAAPAVTAIPTAKPVAASPPRLEMAAVVTRSPVGSAASTAPPTAATARATTILPPAAPWPGVSAASSSSEDAEDSSNAPPRAPTLRAVPPDRFAAARASSSMPPLLSPLPPKPSATAAPGGLDFLGEARRLAARGIRYNGRWTPPGQRSDWVMDCSNTSRYLYQAVAGIDIGRTASDQYYFLQQKGRAWDVPMGWDHKPKLGYLREHLHPGDLLFWENTYKPVRKPDITHVMVFLGEDAQGRWQMAGSQTSRGVNIYNFDAQAPKGGYSSWFGLVHHEGRFVAYGRPLGRNDE